MIKPENCYILALSPGGTLHKSRLIWRTEENNHAVEYDREPARSGWQRLQAKFLSHLPLEHEL